MGVAVVAWSGCAGHICGGVRCAARRAILQQSLRDGGVSRYTLVEESSLLTCVVFGGGAGAGAGAGAGGGEKERSSLAQGTRSPYLCNMSVYNSPYSGGVSAQDKRGIADYLLFHGDSLRPCVVPSAQGVLPIRKRHSSVLLPQFLLFVPLSTLLEENAHTLSERELILPCHCPLTLDNPLQSSLKTYKKFSYLKVHGHTGYFVLDRSEGATLDEEQLTRVMSIGK